jgi:hypothetical protein
MKPVYNTVVAALKNKGWTLSLTRLNIIGMRQKEKLIDSYNDYICVLYIERNRWKFKAYSATTLPGKYWLVEKLMNPKGSLILSPGKYSGAFQLGKHKNKYEALVQAKPLPVYRDVNRDEKIDYENLETGFFGVNIHKREGLSDLIGKNSAGCQVIKEKADFEEFMNLCKERGKSQSSFDYILLEY